MHGAAMLRIGGEFVGAVGLWHPVLLAALAWWLAALLWLLRHGPWLWQPRADGRPG